MPRPRILFDVDGPMTNGFVEVTCQLIEEMAGIPAKSEDVHEWDIMKAFQVPDVLAQQIYEVLRMPGVARRFKPLPGSQEFIAEVRTWAEVYAVTSPLGGPSWAHDRETWLGELYDFPLRKVISAREKFPIHGDAIVEDKLSHIVEWKGAHPNGLAVLWRIPPNRHDVWTPEASTYDELRRLLQPLRDAA